jgi:hypothetical protein
MFTKTRLTATAACAAALVLGAAHDASAATVPEWDHVAGSTSLYGWMNGDIYWSSYTHASGNIKVQDDSRIAFCEALYDRIQVNGVWQGWRWEGSVCSGRTFTFPVDTQSGGKRVTYWEFKAVQTTDGSAVYDNNQPGGD